MSEGPHSPAAIPDDVDEPEDPLTGLATPPAPDLGTVTATLLSGAVVFVMTGLLSGALFTWLFQDLKSVRDDVGAAVFGSLAGVVVLLALAKWWSALRSREESGSRWSGLAMPFFIVVGVTIGWAASNDIFPVEQRGQPGDWRSRKICRQLNYRAEGGPGWSECLAVAAKCEVVALANTNRWTEFEDCVSSGWTPVRAPS